MSIGTTFRSSNIFDSNDKAQRMEIDAQLSLAKHIYDRGVGVIIESPGHARPKDIRDESIKTAKLVAHIIDINNLDETSMDFEVAKARADSATCVLGQATKSCDRCKDLCPLIIR